MKISSSPSPERPEVTVVVPLYNAQKYLQRCLDSVRNQSFQNWECVLVDDGSSDNSASLCAEYQREDSRFILIHQANNGPGHARLTGVQYARGAMITFLDSDDMLESGALDSLLTCVHDGIYVVWPALRTVQPQFRAGRAVPQENIYRLQQNKDTVKPDASSSEKSGTNALYYLYDHNMVISNQPLLSHHGKLIAKSLFENIIVPRQGLVEDVFIVFQILARVQWHNVAVTGAVVYTYFIDHPTSLLAKQFRQFRCSSFMESPYANSKLLVDFLGDQHFDEAMITNYTVNREMPGYLHCVNLYLMLNQRAPAQEEVKCFYHLYQHYKAIWRPMFYMRPTIPVFYYFPRLSRFYRLFLALANGSREYVKKLRRSLYDKFAR